MSHRGGRGGRGGAHGRGGRPGSNNGRAAASQGPTGPSTWSPSPAHTTPGGLVLSAGDSQNPHGKRTSDDDTNPSEGRSKRTRVSTLDRLNQESEAISQTSYRQRPSGFSGPANSNNDAMAPPVPGRNQRVQIPTDWSRRGPFYTGAQVNGLSLVTPATLSGPQPALAATGHLNPQAPPFTPNSNQHVNPNQAFAAMGQFQQQANLRVAHSIPGPGPQILANVVTGGLADNEHGSDSDSSSNGPALYPPDSNESDGGYEDSDNTFNIMMQDTVNSRMGNFNYDPILDGLDRAPLSPDSEDRQARAVLSPASMQNSLAEQPQFPRYDPAKDHGNNMIPNGWDFPRAGASDLRPNGTFAGSTSAQNVQIGSGYPDVKNAPFPTFNGYQQMPLNKVPSGFEDGQQQDVYQIHYAKNGRPRPPNPDYLSGLQPPSRAPSKPPSSSAASSESRRQTRNSGRGNDPNNPKLLGYYADAPVAHKVLVLGKLFHVLYLLERHGFPDRLDSMEKAHEAIASAKHFYQDDTIETEFEVTTEGMQTVVHEVCSQFRGECVKRLQPLIVRLLGLFPSGNNPATKEPYTPKEEAQYVQDRVQYLEEENAARYAHKDFLMEPCADQAFASNILEATVKMLIFDGNKKEQSYYARIPGFARSRIPYPVLPFVLTIIQHTIDEHRTGTYKKIEFSREAYLDTYNWLSEDVFEQLSNDVVRKHVDARLAKWHRDRTQPAEQAAKTRDRKIKMRVRSSMTSEQAADRPLQQGPLDAACAGYQHLPLQSGLQLGSAATRLAQEGLPAPQ
uniref:DUF6532 domain-containing protein n=1 Tax=Mycena chlorophos TaxID=658473 RepID=A0ABQ0LKI4_MYCCL|nr:predicted protein [Mycena chlorophos]